MTEPSQTTGHTLHLIVSRGLSVPLTNVLHVSNHYFIFSEMFSASVKTNTDLSVRVMSVPAQLIHSPVSVQCSLALLSLYDEMMGNRSNTTSLIILYILNIISYLLLIC